MDYSAYVVGTAIFVAAGLLYYCAVDSYCRFVAPRFKSWGWDVLADYPSAVVYFTIFVPILGLLVFS